MCHYLPFFVVLAVPQQHKVSLGVELRALVECQAWMG
jgi:hypothetical protein